MKMGKVDRLSKKLEWKVRVEKDIKKSKIN